MAKTKKKAAAKADRVRKTREQIHSGSILIGVFFGALLIVGAQYLLKTYAISKAKTTSQYRPRTEQQRLARHQALYGTRPPTVRRFARAR